MTYQVEHISAYSRKGGATSVEIDGECWIVREDDEISQNAVFCFDEDRANAVAQALNAYNNGHLTVHVQIDGRDVAKAVMPHLASAVRHSTGSRNF